MSVLLSTAVLLTSLEGLLWQDPLLPFKEIGQFLSASGVNVFYFILSNEINTYRKQNKSNINH